MSAIIADENGTLAVVVHVHRLEGKYPAARIVERDVIPAVRLRVPMAEVSEVRPDWGDYFPVLTLPALERWLRRNGYLSGMLPDLCSYYYGFE